MAWAEKRGGTWRIGYRTPAGKHTFAIGDVAKADADAFVAATEELLRLVKRNVVAVPDWCTLDEFLFHKGNPPKPAPVASPVLRLDELVAKYLAAQTGKLEDSTLAASRLHFAHLGRILGADRRVDTLARPDLQAYADARAAEWIDPNVYRERRRAVDAAKKPRRNRKPPPPRAGDKPRRHPSAATIRKEIVSLRTAWNWGRGHLGLGPEFPGSRLAFAKTEEKMPFVTWDEAERRIAAGDDPDRVWACVYLRPHEIAEFLGWVKTRPVSPWVYPMLCFAAHTGSRRSEIVRALASDLDLTAGVVTLREKKRDRRQLTTRQVPLSPFLAGVLRDWVGVRAGGRTLFCKGSAAAVTPREAQNYLRRAVRVSKWRVLKGWHVFRHSFISALASQGTDQRVIDDMVGHSTEQQRRRYRHLYPDVRQKAVAAAFGSGVGNDPLESKPG